MKQEEKGTVLVVDDEAANLGVLFEFLRQADFKVLVAEDGASALERVKRSQPDIVLLDVKLPDIDGFDLYPRLKETSRDAHLPVIFLTVMTETEDKVRAFDMHVVDYITKPFQPLEVVARVKKHLLLRSLRRRLEEQNAQLQQEITERKRAEEALRVAAQEWRTTFDAINDVVCLMGVEGKILRCNMAIKKLVGKPFDEIIGRTCWKLVHGTTERPAGCPVVRMWETCRRATQVLPIGDRWFEIAADPLLDEDGNIIGGVHIMSDITKRVWAEESLQKAHDELEIRVQERTAELVKANEALRAEITERKRAEEEIRQRNQELAALNYQLSLLLEASKAVSSSLDREGVLQTMAQKLTELAKVTYCRIALLDETGEGLIVRGAYPIAAELDWEPGLGQRYPLAAAPWQRRVIDTGELVLWQRDHSPTLSKEELMVSLHAGIKAVAFIPVILKGRVIGVVSLGERRGWERSPLDDTKINLCQALINEMVMAIENARLYEETVQRAEQIARAERHLASVVESANDLIVSMDSEGGIATWNQTAERISGFTSEEVTGKRLASFCDKEHQADMEAMLEQVARGEQITDREMNLLARAGQRIPVAWSCSLMQDKEGQAMGIVAVGRDLTERRRLEAQLIQSAKMASLGVMAGGIAHEIRNPLAVSSAVAQLLLESPDDEELRTECAEKIYSGIQRASVIVENLLRFARPSEGRKAPADINETVEATLFLLAHQMTRHRIALETDLRPQLPPVMGNKNLLQQVFSNMILNACNAMPDGGRLTVETRLNADNEVEIRFTDTGCGIPEENLAKIFDPFFTTMPVGKGTGLGLSICYAIVQQHQGAIDIHSEVGVGSTFVIRLPVIGVEKRTI